MHTWGLFFCIGVIFSMTAKEFKSIDEQIELLQSRGLIIDDKKAAKNFLLNNNYYRISGYSLTLRSNDKFHDNVTFQNIIDIYNFDRELRTILFNYIEIFEVNFKSVYAYKFSELYGPFGYLESKNFMYSTDYFELVNKIFIQIKRNTKNELYLQHFINDLKENIPFWALVDLLTISDISKLYVISPDNLKKSVAKTYYLTHNSSYKVMENYLHCMTILRNFCAHGSRLYNRLFATKPSLSKNEKKLLLKDEQNIIDNSKLFGYIIILKRVLSKTYFNEMKTEINTLCEKYPFVDMKYYGFNKNRMNIL